jgi:hypothetical protein
VGGGEVMNVDSSVDPFPHWILSDAWDETLLDRVVSEVPLESDPRWKRYQSKLEGKLEGGTSTWGPAATELAAALSDPQWISTLSSLTGIDGLIPEFIGGGLHRIERGGLLGIHADFNISPETGRYRRLNCLIYLNRDWGDEYGGHLELWKNKDDKSPSVSISPIFNQTVVFETSDTSFHGHPHPLTCPPERSRLSFAVYYYTDAPPPHASQAHSTIFLETP